MLYYVFSNLYIHDTPRILHVIPQYEYLYLCVNEINGFRIRSGFFHIMRDTNSAIGVGVREEERCSVNTM
jgi:hypothetical protein